MVNLLLISLIISSIIKIQSDLPSSKIHMTKTQFPSDTGDSPTRYSPWGRVQEAAFTYSLCAADGWHADVEIVSTKGTV